MQHSLHPKQHFHTCPAATLYGFQGFHLPLSSSGPSCSTQYLLPSQSSGCAPTTAESSVLSHLGPPGQLQLLEKALTAFQAWGRCHPALKSESKQIPVIPPRHAALQAPCGMHREAGYSQGSCCLCQTSKCLLCLHASLLPLPQGRGEMGRGTEKLLGKRNQSFLLLE